MKDVTSEIRAIFNERLQYESVNHNAIVDIILSTTSNLCSILSQEHREIMERLQHLEKAEARNAGIQEVLAERVLHTAQNTIPFNILMELFLEAKVENIQLKNELVALKENSGGGVFLDKEVFL